MLERAGADAIQIEDQVFPKRCGHFDGKETIPKSEMVAKVKAAADARGDLDLIIVARTDAIATDGFEAALDRADGLPRSRGGRQLHRGAADRSSRSRPSASSAGRRSSTSCSAGARRRCRTTSSSQLGFAGVLYANVALQASIRGMQLALGTLRENGAIGDASLLAVDFSERQRLVGKPEWDALEQKYKN